MVLWGDEASALERAALALAGPGCDVSQPAVVETLQRLDGIARVRADLIPDHLMVDYDGRLFTEKTLADFVNALGVTRGRCHATIMRSCVTASLGARAGLSPPAY